MKDRLLYRGTPVVDGSEGGMAEIVELAEEGGCLGSTQDLCIKARQIEVDDDEACGSGKRQPVKVGEVYDEVLWIVAMQTR